MKGVVFYIYRKKWFKNYVILQKSREYFDLLFYWLLNLTNFWSDNIRKESNPKVELFNLTTLPVRAGLFWYSFFEAASCSFFYINPKNVMH
jgi:hypothetical protein